MLVMANDVTGAVVKVVDVLGDDTIVAKGFVDAAIRQDADDEEIDIPAIPSISGDK